MNGKTKKLLALLLVLCLSAGCLAACGKSPDPVEPAADLVDQTILQAASDLLPTHGSTEGKEETVYVIADAQGQPERTIVSAWLKNPDETDTITDRSDLNGIENVKGDESFTKDADGSLVWDAHGNDIYYQGDSDRELPLAVRVSYKLDGKLVSPEELAGASGHLEMTFRYENKTGREEEIDGKTVTIYQPFVAVSCLVLDASKASAVEVTNGTTINSGEQLIVAGLAMPGLKESLGLDELEDADGEALDADLPETVTINADVHDFSLLTTVTLVENALLNDVDLENVESFDDLKDSVSKLANASASLVDGAGDLYNGTKALSGGMTEVVNGAASVAANLATVQEGVGKLAVGSAQLLAGVDQASTLFSNKATEDIAAAQKQVQGSSKDMITEIFALNQSFTGVKTALGNIQTTVSNLTLGDDTEGKLTAIGESSGTITATASAEKDALTQAKTDIDAIIDGLSDAGLPEENETALRTAFDHAIDAALAQTKAISTESTSITENVGLVGTGLETAKSELSGKLQTNIDELTSAMTGFSTNMLAIEDLSTQLGTLETNLETLKDLDLAKSFGDLQQGAAAVNEGAKELNDPKAGVPALAAGAAALKDGTQSLAAGVNQVADGANALLSGLRTFDGDGVKVLSRLFEEDAQGFMDRLRAVQAYGEEYDNFSGLADGMPGTVRFVIRTDSIGE